MFISVPEHCKRSAGSAWKTYQTQETDAETPIVWKLLKVKQIFAIFAKLKPVLAFEHFYRFSCMKKIHLQQDITISRSDFRRNSDYQVPNSRRQRQDRVFTKRRKKIANPTIKYKNDAKILKILFPYINAPPKPKLT